MMPVLLQQIDEFLVKEKLTKDECCIYMSHECFLSTMLVNGNFYGIKVKMSLWMRGTEIVILREHNFDIEPQIKFFDDENINRTWFNKNRFQFFG